MQDFSPKAGSNHMPRTLLDLYASLVDIFRSIFSRRISIKHHIVGHFFLALTLILAVSGVAIYSFVYDNMQQNMMEKLSTSTTSIKDVVENAANLAIRNHLQAIAKVNIDILNGLEQQVKDGKLTRTEAMKRGQEILLNQRIGDHGYIYALSSKGVIRVHPNAELINRDISEFWFVQQQIFYKNGYLEYDWKNPGEENARPKSLHMAYFEPWDWIVSVSSYRQEFNFLANDLRLGLNSHRFGKTGYAFIVNGGGDIILHPWLRGNVHAMGDASIEFVLNRIIALKNGVFSYDWNDQEGAGLKKKIVFFNYIPGLDWIVASTVYENEIFQPLEALGRAIALIVVCALVLILPVSLYLGTLITRPLSRLAQQMHVATAGDLSVRAETDALGEIGLLGRHFNHYIERLRHANQEIRAEINERVQAEHQLLIYHKAFEYALEGISITDAEGNILAVNRAFSEITGYAPEEVIGENPRILKSDKHDLSFYTQMWTTLHETGRWRGEIWNQRKNGEVFPEILRIRAIYDENKEITHYVAVFHDITEVKQQEEQIVHQAYHDALTGLPNRTLAHDRINVSIAHVRRSGTKLAVLFLDLDNFKNVNEIHGHELGDTVLLQVANRLVSQVREEDTVARLGGDEFLILVAAITSEEVVIDLVRRLLQSFAAPFNVGESELIISASIGVAFYPQDGGNAGVLTKHADIAMYQAKVKGKNNYCLFTSDLSDRIHSLRQLNDNLRQAVLNQEFIVFFQPKIDTFQGVVTGAEALVRWQQQDGTVVSPADFIPLAEETGLIIPIGEQVLDIACQVLRMLNDQGLTKFSISVNLSPLQFVQTNLVERILATLAKHGVPASQLELEITETAMMTNLGKTVETLNQLVAAGIAISIDDFGTGYSSLSYLKRFPINTLKIDRSFIRDLANDTSDAQLVETIILMAHNLGIDVVAEGVETKEQLDWLKSCGCQQIQGYFYSKPLQVEAFFAYLEARALDVVAG
jgi:diguanylate cyclase (GGDEF)-like protein/PAS domain S-box-containing protein